MEDLKEATSKSAAPGSDPRTAVDGIPSWIIAAVRVATLGVFYVAAGVEGIDLAFWKMEPSSMPRLCCAVLADGRRARGSLSSRSGPEIQKNTPVVRT